MENPTYIARSTHHAVFKPSATKRDVVLVIVTSRGRASQPSQGEASQNCTQELKIAVPSQSQIRLVTESCMQSQSEESLSDDYSIIGTIKWPWRGFMALND